MPTPIAIIGTVIYTVIAVSFAVMAYQTWHDQP